MASHAGNSWIWLWTSLVAGFSGCSAESDVGKPSQSHSSSRSSGSAGDQAQAVSGDESAQDSATDGGETPDEAAGSAGSSSKAADSGGGGGGGGGGRRGDDARGAAGKASGEGGASAGDAQSGSSARMTAGADGANEREPAAAGGTNATAGQGGTAGEGGTGMNTGDSSAPAPTSLDDLPAADSFARLEATQLGAPKLLSNKFDLAEAPIWDPCEKRMLFVDVNNRKIHTVSADDQIGVYIDETNYTNGLSYDREGYLWMAEMGGGAGGRITRMSRAGEVEVIIDHGPTGSRLQTTDDLTLRSDGTVYFTDPIISHGPYRNDLGSLGSHPFYLLKPGAGEREIVRMGTLRLPNGIRLSRDEKTLYVASYGGDRIMQYTVAADGGLASGKDFVTNLNQADSMCLDLAGNIYIGVDAGLQVLRPDGSRVKLLPVQSATTSCGFGGPDGKTLYITAWKLLLRVDNMPIPGLDWAKNQSMACQ